MDTSTPVKNDFKSTRSDNISHAHPVSNWVAEYSKDSSEYCDSTVSFSSVENTKAELLCPPSQNLNKSAELFPCSPIPQKNIPQTLLPLLDTPNYKWSDSLLTPYKFDMQNGTPSQIVQLGMFSDDENLQNESPDYTISSFQVFSDAKSVSGQQNSLSDKQFLNDSPIIQARQKLQSKKLGSFKCINKKLFPVLEEDAGNGDFSYQRMYDTTLNAMEHSCQISETLYCNSSIVVRTADDDSENVPNFRCITAAEDDRCRRKFVYPFDVIRKPCSPVLVDQVIESAIALEKCERVCIRKSQPIPRAMVSFNELNNCDGDEIIAQNAYRSNSESNLDTLVPIIRRYENVYHSLKTFFVICRVDFAQMRDVIMNYTSVTSLLSVLCKKQELITRLYEELSVMEKKVRIRLLEQFFNIFKYHFYFAYNGFKLSKSKFCLIYSFRDRKYNGKKSTVVRQKRNISEQVQVNVTIFQTESLAVAQELLADVQDSDFKIDLEVDQFLTETKKHTEREPSSDLVLFTRSRCPRELRKSWSLNSNQEFVGFEISTTSKDSAQSFKNKSISDGSVVDLTKQLPDFQISPSFSTADGKRINVPKKLLHEGQEMLESVSKNLRHDEIDTKVLTARKPLSKMINISGAEFFGFKTASGVDIEVKEQLLSHGQAMLESIVVDSTDQIVPTYLEASRVSKTVSKRSLQMTSPQRVPPGPKRIKTEEQTENLECSNPIVIGPFSESSFTSCSSGAAALPPELIASVEIAKKISEEVDLKCSQCSSIGNKRIEDVQDSVIFSENLSKSVIEEFLNDYLSDDCMSRPASPEICSNSRSVSAKKFIRLEPAVTQNEVSFKYESTAKKEESASNRLELFKSGLNHNKNEFLPTEVTKIATGFNTAAGHELKVPGEALKKVENLFHDIDDEFFAQVPESLFSSNINPAALNEFQKIDTSRMTVGFNTAAGNRLEVPLSCLEKGQKIFESVHEDLQKRTLKRPVSPEISQNLKPCATTRPNVLRTTLKNKKEEFKMVDVSKISVGFNTAAGNKLNIPESALKKAQKIFECVDEDFFEEISKRPISPELGRDLKTCTSTRPNRLQFASENKEEEFEIVDVSKISVGFNTAAGNELNVSESALKKTQQIFEGVYGDISMRIYQCPISPEIGRHLRTCSSTRPKLAENSTIINEGHASNVATGFNTAVGNALHVPKSALENGQQFLDRVEGDSFEKTSEPPVSPEIGFSLSTQRKVLEIAMKKKGDFETEVSNIAVGFNTAAGNKLNIPKLAFEKAQKLFQSVDEDLFNESSQNRRSTRNISCRLRRSSDENELIPLEKNERMEEESPPQISKLTLKKAKSIKFISDQTGLDCQNAENISLDTSAVSVKRKMLDFSQGLVERESNVDLLSGANFNFNLRSNDSGLVNSMTVKSVQTSSGPAKIAPSERFRPSSPVLGIRKSNQQKRRQKRRSQASSVTLTPLNITYSGKENESTLSSKSSPEDMFRMIKDNFARLNKRKETVSGMMCPILKRPKESSPAPSHSLEGPKKDCSPRSGSYPTNLENEKRMTLREAVNGLRPGRYTSQQLIQFGLMPSVVAVNAGNAAQFVFSSDFPSGDNSIRTYGNGSTIIPNENNEIRFEEVARGFFTSPGVDPKLITEAWIRNHYRWIVWKLAAFEKSYPHLFAGKYLTLDNVLHQLKYRYEREINRCERSALKRILECDDSPSKPLILCVASIRPVAGVFNEFDMELTDGWYSVLTQLDIEMYKLIVKKQVVVGSKLLIMNAELIGSRGGSDPLELDSTVRLKIATNSTRLVRWDTRLGFHSSSAVPVVRDLKAVLPEGGITYPILAVVARVYPLLYMEKNEGRHSELYNEKVEFKKAACYDRERQACWEQLASVVTHEVEQENNVNDGDEDVNTEMNADMIELLNRRILDQEKLHSLIKERIESRLPNKFRGKRKIIRLLKIRIINDYDGNTHTSSSAMLTVWHPSEDVISLIKEGRLYLFYNLNANDVRNQELQLSSNRMTRYELQTTLPKSSCYQRRYTPISDLKHDYLNLFNEIDTVGVVIGRENGSRNDGCSQPMVYLADLNQNIVAVKFRFDLKDYGFEEILKHKNVVAAINLQWKRGFLPCKLPLAFVTEHTTFTQISRYHHLQGRLDEFGIHFKIRCLDAFVEECEKKLKLFIESRFPPATSTPIKFIASKIATSNCIDESNKSNSEVDTRSNKSKDTQSRIERLRQYGEPPPLSPIIMSSISNGRRGRARRSIQTCSFRSNDSKL